MKNKRVLAQAILLCLSISLLSMIPVYAVGAGAGSFSDVPRDAWYYKDVMSAVDLGLVNGTSATTFSPDKNITYFEVYKLAACLHQLSSRGEVTLTSGSGKWYSTYIEYNYENGILDSSEGFENTERLGEFAVSRAEFMSIFSKALPENKLRAINEVEDGAIPDVAPNQLYKNEIYMLYRAGILRGSDAFGSCFPIEEISRAEVAAILTRMVDENARLHFKMTVATGIENIGGGSAKNTENASNAGETQGIFWRGNQLIAVKSLGYNLNLQDAAQKPDFKDFATRFPAAKDPILVEMEGDEIYCIIPRYKACSVAIYVYDAITDERIGTPVYEGSNRPILLKCNISELFPNSMIVVEYKDQVIEYSPRIDLAFGDLFIPNPDKVADMGNWPVNKDGKVNFLGEWVYDGYEFSEYGIDYYVHFYDDGTMDCYIRWLENDADEVSAIYKGYFYPVEALNDVTFIMELVGGDTFAGATDAEKRFEGSYRIRPSAADDEHITMEYLYGDELIFGAGYDAIEFVDATLGG